MRLSVAVFSAFLLTGLPALAAERPDFETCSKSEEPEVAVESCTRVIDDPALAPQVRGAALFFRSLALETKRDLKGAMADLDEAIRIDPKPSHAHSGRARLYKEAGDDEHAFADFREAIRLAPTESTMSRDALESLGAGEPKTEPEAPKRGVLDLLK